MTNSFDASIIAYAQKVGNLALYLDQACSQPANLSQADFGVLKQGEVADKDLYMKNECNKVVTQVSVATTHPDVSASMKVLTGAGGSPVEFSSLAVGAVIPVRFSVSHRAEEDGNTLLFTVTAKIQNYDEP